MARLPLQLLCLVLLAAESSSFQISPLSRQTSITTTTTSLASASPEFSKSTVILPDDSDFQFDTGVGGVRLAQESAIKLTGTVKKKGDSAKAGFKDLIRYTALQEVSDSQVQGQLQKVGATVVCTGKGQEMYKDPGNALEQVVVLGPLDCVEDALKGGAKAASDASEVVINFLGGDDLQFLEVQEALEILVPQLDIGKAKVQFNSLCHASIPLGSVSVTAVALPADASSNGMSGVDKAVADGEVYFRDGKWWTVVQEKINPALA